MEYITSLTEAVEFVRQFIVIEDLVILPDFEYATVMNAGFEEIDNPPGAGHWSQWYQSREGKLEIHNDCSEANFYANDQTYMNIYSRKDGLLYDVRGLNFNGILCGLWFTFRRLGQTTSVKITGVDLSYDEINVDSVERFTSIHQPVVDTDGNILKCQTIYCTAIGKKNVYYRNSRRKHHCLFGPAVTRDDKTEYYIRGVKMSRRRWLVERQNPQYSSEEDGDL
jgi:hypothetical protein